MTTARKVGGGTGNRGLGRPKGSKNKTTKVLKEAILRAAELSGQDTQGKDGVVGYCKRLADDEPKAFSQLLGKVLPMQVTGDEDGGPLQVVIKEFKP